MRKRQHRVEVRLNDIELKRLEECCAECNLSKQQVLRKLLTMVILVKPPTIEYDNLIRQLRMLGNNINQLVVLARKNGFANQKEIKKELDDLHLLEKHLYKIFDFREWLKDGDNFY